MADRLRRQRDAYKKKINDYIKASAVDYVKYWEGSPTYVTYYQLDQVATTQDVGLESVNSLVGRDSPNRYKRIYNAVLYGIDAQSIANEINERGFTSNVTGEFTMLPDSITPYPGDFFSIDLEGFEEHLFKVNEVQTDRITPKKFYRCQYNLYPNNADSILNNIEDDYELQYSNIGGEDSTIIKKATALSNERAEKLVDKLIDRFTNLFYNDDMDTFLFYDRTNNTYYWSPYLQHFLHENKVIQKFSPDFMKEIYISDINERDFQNIYNDLLYRDSIFRAVETQDKSMLENNLLSNFINVEGANLKSTRNLPFFQSSLNFSLLSPVESSSSNNENNYEMHTYCKPLLFDDVIFGDVPHTRKVHKMDDLHLARLAPYLKVGDIVYECKYHELNITKICRVTENNGFQVKVEDIGMSVLLNESTTNKGSELFEVVRDFVNNKLRLDDNLFEKLNNAYYSNDLKDYILMPLAVFCIKKQLEDDTI